MLDLRPHTSSVLGTMGDNISELARTYWEEIGIKINYKQIAQELQSQLLNGERAGHRDLRFRALHAKPPVIAAAVRWRRDHPLHSSGASGMRTSAGWTVAGRAKSR